MGLLKGRGVVNPISRHRYHLAIGLQGLNDAQLLLRRHPGIDTAASHHRAQLLITASFQFPPQHHLTIEGG